MKQLDDDDPFRELEPMHNVVPLRADTPFPPREAYAAEFPPPEQPPGASLSATPFTWRDPSSIPPRPWVYGQHMIRKQVSVTVAPGGVGKSSLTLLEAISLASGRQLLGDWVPSGGLRVWVYNLEDPRDEMERRVIGAMIFHCVNPGELRAVCSSTQAGKGRSAPQSTCGAR